MKLFVQQVANGISTIVGEFTDNEQGAKIKYHQTCRALWNDAPTTNALVEIKDENLRTWQEPYREVINKTGIYPVYDPDVMYSNEDIVSYDSKYYEYIADYSTSGNPPTDTDYWREYTPLGKLFVMAISNSNLDIKNITEWIPSITGIIGAMVDYHGKCASLLNDGKVLSANVKILNENLDTWMQKSEYIFHIVEPEPEPEEA